MAKYSNAGTKSVVSILRKDPCAFCQQYHRYPPTHKKAGKKHATVDHIHPKSKGGANSWTNYTAACPTCNSHKGDNSLLGYLLGADIPSNIIVTETYILPMRWFDPLNILARTR